MPRKRKDESRNQDAEASGGKIPEDKDSIEIYIESFPAKASPKEDKLKMVGSLSIPSLAKRWKIEPNEEGLLEVMNVMLLFSVPLWGGPETLESYLAKESRRGSVPGLPDSLIQRACEVARVYLDDVLEFEKDYPEVPMRLQGKEYKALKPNRAKEIAILVYKVLAIRVPDISAKEVWESKEMFELVHKPYRDRSNPESIGNPTTLYDWLTAEGIKYGERKIKSGKVG
jgi:hypothetical protein